MSKSDYKKKLAEMRKKYGNSVAGDVFDPAFKKVVDLIFKGGERRAKPYEGVSSFLDAPLMLDAIDKPDLGGLDVAMIGVPMDLGVTNRPGSRFGPRAVRTIERVGPYSHIHRIVPISHVKIADIGDVAFRSRFSLEQSHEDIEAFVAKVVKAGVVPLAVGGDHSISLPILKAVGRDRPVGMIHIDAHCDTSGPFEGSKFHHGGPFREAVLAGVLDPTRSIQIGIRGASEYLWEFSYDSGMTVIHAEDLDKLSLDGVASRIREVVGSGPTYVTFDIDSLDPAHAPGTGTPEIGGLSTREALAILRSCAGLDIVGGDMVEVAPQYDTTANTAHAGAQVLFEIASLIALNVAKKKAAKS